MSWWEITGDDLMGDGPVDTLTEMLVAIGVTRQEKGQAEPTLAEILVALAAVLHEDGARVLDDGPQQSIQRIVARNESDVELASGEASGKADPAIVALLRQALAKIQRQYEEPWERKPRLRELLESLTFILRVQPDSFLSEPEDLGIDKIVVAA